MKIKKYRDLFFMCYENGFDFNDFENDNLLKIPEEYKAFLNKISLDKGFKKRLFFHAFADNISHPPNTKYSKEIEITRFYDLTTLIEYFTYFKNYEKDVFECYGGFKGYNSQGIIPIADLAGGIGLQELFLDCGFKNNGGVYLLDKEIYYSIDEEGHPLKIKLADSFSEFIDLLVR